MKNQFKPIKKVFKPLNKTIRIAKHRFHDIKQGIRLDYSPKVEKILERYGNKKVVQIKLKRKPIDQGFKFALDNVFNLKKEIELKGYDNVFHLAMEYILEDGTRILNEKEEKLVIDMIINDKKYFNKVMVINLNNKNKTLLDYQNNAQQKFGNKKFFTYDTSYNNCQYYINYILDANNLKTPQTDEFVLQDIKLPDKYNRVIRKLTDIAALGDVILNGNGN